ncbi:Putative Zn-dependent protease, contains TPR repeats [Marinospirillum celere]|uniref:Putative beta-barrel assembly-enhancing protease n=1 Tax=Marinospirillum celere TaxID=1122252 RepID=A0A1I1IUI4_9GAMM|nr:M48 family metalloprotease [Marinospirillum celere]SFC39947.1 Putative Zn-dependent protease, contains TPR repeats [Marinospirillum celere]
MQARCLAAIKVVTLLLLVGSLKLPAWSQDLPTLGHASTYDISLHQERHLGQGWMRQFRAQTRIYYDPLTQNYTEDLVQRLAAYNSSLEQRELEVLVVDQRQLNAFAVPGGIIGVNTGLFVFATHEDEFASVMAHELAHISQRHFARRVEAARGAQWSTMAGLLAGILVASQGHADAGIAAIAGTQAAAIQSQLAWSRTYEQEADRIGMETLAAAGYSPEAMPAMFQQMQRLASLSGRPPEFLMTHPLTESRIADAWSRADQLASTQKRVKGQDYELIRARLIFRQESSSEDARRIFLQQSPSEAGKVYADILKMQYDGELDAAIERMEALQQAHPERLALQYLLAELLMEAEYWSRSQELLSNILAITPGYYPARYLLADGYAEQGDWSRARQEFRRLSRDRAKDPQIWFQFAEAAGKSDRPVEVHQARAEYFQLTGRFRQAFAQLELALERARELDQPWQVREVIRERRRELEELQQLMDL